MEHVILLDESGCQVGIADKATVHHADTPLHLAFSCYVFDSRGRLLLTQRAWTKKTWPGVWTNSCCGHPAPGESIADSVHRRLEQELGVRATSLDLVLPRFRYRAEMDSGVVENEMCPVFRAHTDDQPAVNPDEVAATRWIAWADLAGGVANGRLALSPWCQLQIAELAALDGQPAEWATASEANLPAAVRPQAA
jgi:isopentenyl-diphosphate delta-isomerase